MRLNRQSGFSMLELLVVMMIIAVIATLGVKKFSEFSAEARYIKAHDTVNIVGMGLDQYFIKHGTYPELASFEAMVDANSVLVKENLIPVGVTSKDPWDQPLEGTSNKRTYVLKCAGDPGGAASRAAFTQEPGKAAGQPAAGTSPAPDNKGAK